MATPSLPRCTAVRMSLTDISATESPASASSSSSRSGLEDKPLPLRSVAIGREGAATTAPDSPRGRLRVRTPAARDGTPRLDDIHAARRTVSSLAGYSMTKRCSHLPFATWGGVCLAAAWALHSLCAKVAAAQRTWRQLTRRLAALLECWCLLASLPGIMDSFVAIRYSYGSV